MHLPAWFSKFHVLAGQEQSGACCAGKAVETPFASCSEEGACTPATAEARVPVQQLRLSIPKDADVASLQFVLRSRDGSKWYRDGASNFSVPAATRGGEAEQPVVDDKLVREIIDAENTSAWTLMHRCAAGAFHFGAHGQAACRACCE